MDQPPLWIDRPPSRDREGRSTERSGASWVDSTRYGGGWGNGPAPEELEPAPTRRFSPNGIWLGAAAAAGVVLLVAGLLIGGAFSGSDTTSGNAGLTITRGRLPVTDVGRVYAAASPAVLSVRVGSASGTGFLINSSGTIITNAHVVSGAQRAEVRKNENSKPIQAQVLGTDQSSDLAALKVDPASLRGVKPLPFADLRDVKVGDRVVAIGYPLGLDRTATAGIVSGLGRHIKAPNGFDIDQVIQTDAPINPGNSGGPLLDESGRVIGINSQIATAAGGGQGNIGIGFAVPSNTMRDVVPRLIAGQQIVRPYMGVTTSPAPAGGAQVVGVVPGGPAQRAGLQPGVDVIVAINGQAVREPNQVSQVIDKLKPGDRIKVEVQRGGKRQAVEVTLGNRPNTVPQGP